MKRIIIIGGGVIGLCAAWYCRAAGHEVVLLERGSPKRDCCSLGNAGLIVPSHIIPLAAPGMVGLGLRMMWNPESPFYLRPRLDAQLLDWGFKFIRACSPEHVNRSAPLLRDINLASKKLFEDLAELPGMDFGLVKRGCVNLCKTVEGLEHERQLAERSQRLGMPAEVLDADATRQLDPDVDMDVAGSVYFPEDAHLSPHRFLAQLEEQARLAGVAVHWDSEVMKFEQHNDRVTAVRTRGETFHGDEFVIAGGAWSSSLGRQLGLRLPLQAGKGYSLTIRHPRQLPRLSYIFTEARLAVTPMMGSLRVGGTMEIAGINTDVNPSRVRGITRSAGGYFPVLQPEAFAGIEPWVGLRPCSPDGLPYVGRTRRWENVCVGTGHAMMGLSLGPITGKLLAEIIDGVGPSHPVDLLDPDRYA